MSGQAAPIPAIPIGCKKDAGGGGAAEAATGGGGAEMATGGGTPAAGGGAPAAPAAKPSAKGSVGAGKKGSIAMTYEFDATADKNTCEGLGGMTAFLAGQGMAASLPSPFGALANGVSAAAFSGNLKSAKFTL